MPSHTPELSLALLKHFSNHLHEVVRILEQVAYDKVEERLWNSLHKWKNEKEEKGGWYPLPKYLTPMSIQEVFLVLSS
jgi:hypothetical protein